LLRRQHRQIAAQTLTDLEWLILDDSPEASPYFTALSDPRVRYHHHAGARMSVGDKRNWLAERAAGDVIAHFDDDDFYAANYLAEMAARIAAGADVAKLSGWFLYSAVYRKFAYWDTALTRGLHFRFGREPLMASMFGEEQARVFARNYLGFGFSYVYRKAVWQAAGFPQEDFGEDLGFIEQALASGAKLDHFADTQGLALHVLRADNASLCWPQYVLPDFLGARLFGPDIEEMTRA
jgi:glycosyltransferase involved in cell wall biosynthesis